MPINCKSVSIEDVIKFFVDDIDGIGKHVGHPRNEGIPDSIRQFQNWEFCELTEEEFMHLIIPDGTNTLIKNKNLDDVEGEDSKNIVQQYINKLKNKENVPLLIVRNKLLNDSPNGSYYIEDGAHRAIALKIYFENNSYEPVGTYIGWKTEN